MRAWVAEWWREALFIVCVSLATFSLSVFVYEGFGLAGPVVLLGAALGWALVIWWEERRANVTASEQPPTAGDSTVRGYDHGPGFEPEATDTRIGRLDPMFRAPLDVNDPFAM